MTSCSTTHNRVLMTPWEIYSTAQQIFPGVKATEIYADGEMTPQIELSLSDSIPPLTLATGVLKKKFVEQLKYSFLQFDLVRADRSKTLEDHQISTSSFAMQAPLKGWTQFRRSMYEASGKKCIDLIKDYLKNSSDTERLLRYCHLLPDQIDDNPTDSDLKYFREMINPGSISKSSSPTSGSPAVACSSLDTAESTGMETNKLIQSLANKYPHIYKTIMNEFVREILKITPVVLSEESKACESILKQLQQSIVGQEPAVKKLAGVLAEQTVEKTNGVFLFVGPSGVGKTELSRAAASKIKGGRLITFNMEKFSSEHTATNLFGPSIGHVGSTSRPPFATELDKFEPTCIEDTKHMKSYVIEDVVVLFDELERAHHKVRDTLLTLFDTGKCTMEYTEPATCLGDSVNITLKYIFKRCIMIGTSNLLDSQILQQFHQGIEFDEIAKKFKETSQTMSGHDHSYFSGPLLNRMEITPFGPIPKGEHYQKIIKKRLDAFCIKLQQKFNFRECCIENEKEVLHILEEMLYGKGDDIRGNNH